MTKNQSAADAAAQSAAGLPEPALAAEAISQVLQPLARLMIDHGLQLPSMVEMLKKALVDEAGKTYGLAGKGSSDTRISLLTGVHRKDVKRLSEMPVSAGLASPMVSVAASVVARWISEPRFLNADQSARALARLAHRTSLDQDVLADALDALSLGSEISDDQAAVLLEAFDVDYAVLHERALKERPLPAIPSAPSAREIKQRLGDCMRQMHPDFWVEALARRADHKGSKGKKAKAPKVPATPTEAFHLHRQAPWRVALDKARELLGLVRMSDTASRVSASRRPSCGCTKAAPGTCRPMASSSIWLLLAVP